MKYLRKEYINLNQNQRLYCCPNPIIGLTGGIATGKSTVSNFFQKKNLHVICADELIHTIYKEKETIAKVTSLCPQVIEGNLINFPLLRKFFFSNTYIKKELESFLYKRLPSAFRASLPKDNEQVVIYDLPLLFEKSLQNQFDQIIAVVTSSQNQLMRLKLRDGKDLDTHHEIISNQWSLDKKSKASNFVIDNNYDITHLQNLLLRLSEDIFY